MQCCSTLPVSRAASLIDTLAISYHPVMHPVSRTVYGKDAPHHRGVSQRSASTSRSSSLLLQQEQRLILDEFSHVQRCFLLFRHKRPQSVSAQYRDVPSAPSLTQSLRFRRSAAASGRSIRITARESRAFNGGEEGKAARRPFFHRLRSPTSITESDAQISGGETRQDYKDTRRFP